MMRLLLTHALFLVLSASSPAGVSATQYTLVDLGPAIVAAIDPDLRTVVGSYLLPEQTAAILYPTTLVLGTLPEGPLLGGQCHPGGCDRGLLWHRALLALYSRLPVCGRHGPGRSGHARGAGPLQCGGGRE